MIRLKQLLQEVLNNEDTYTVMLMTVTSRPTELTVDDQLTIIAAEILHSHRIDVYDYDDISNILKAIELNPTAFVILFEDACLWASDIAKKLNNKRRMFIAAPTEDLKIDASIARARNSGVPANHVFRLSGKPDSYQIDSKSKTIESAAKGIMWYIDHPENLEPSPDNKPEPDVEKSTSNVPKININDFKRQWRALGHTIKISPIYPPPDELTNGGTVDEEMLGIVLKLITEYGELYPGLPKVEISAGNDWFHQHKLSYVSKHTLGLAIDIVPRSNRRVLELEDLIIQFKKKYTKAKFDWINEFINPSPAATGPHYHLFLNK